MPVPQRPSSEAKKAVKTAVATVCQMYRKNRRMLSWKNFSLITRFCLLAKLKRFDCLDFWEFSRYSFFGPHIVVSGFSGQIIVFLEKEVKPGGGDLGLTCDTSPLLLFALFPPGDKNGINHSDPSQRQFVFTVQTTIIYIHARSSVGPRLLPHVKKGNKVFLSASAEKKNLHISK